MNGFTRDDVEALNELLAFAGINENNAADRARSYFAPLIGIRDRIVSLISQPPERGPEYVSIDPSLPRFVRRAPDDDGVMRWEGSFNEYGPWQDLNSFI